MIYPSVGQYTEAIKLADQSPEDYFATMTTLRPVLGADGNPVMSSGNFAVVFKMQDQNDGKIYALKCFTRDQEGRNESYRLIADELQYVESEYLTKIQYLEKELFVDTGTDDTEFPVLLMDWVEGETLDKYIRKNIHDKYSLSMLAFRFSRLAMWLMPQPFAHGDLKPDNIIVRKDGSLTLVDYDGMFVPAMKGQKSRELGSPDFRHPLRTEEDFDEHIDDFSLSTILLSLKAISLQPSLLEEFGAADRLLFSQNDYRKISECKFLDAVKTLMDDSELQRLYSLFLIVLAEKSLVNVTFRLFNVGRPKSEDYSEELFSTEVTDDEIDEGLEDEFGVVYSNDGKRLLKCNNWKLKEYNVKKGTRVICNGAFYVISEEQLKEWKNEYSNDSMLQKITIPNGVIYIGDWAFGFCKSLQSIIIPDTVKQIGFSAFKDCHSLQSVNIPNRVTYIDEQTFEYCTSLQHIIIPNGVKHIEDAFASCWLLESITLPNTLVSISEDVFFDCRLLKEIIIPVGSRSKFEQLLPKYKDIFVEQ